ncbi:MAG: hypothetical protein ACHQXL_04800, partial [Candidatus Limnocylindrales bacterium]
SPDPAARALAASAGLPVYATVGEYEADQGDQLAGPLPPATPPPAESAKTGQGAARAVAAAGVAGAAAGAAAGGPGVAGPGSSVAAAKAGTQAGARAGASPVDARVGARSSATSAAATRPAGRASRSAIPLVATGLAVVAILVVLGLVGAFVLPSSTITITPKVEQVGPLQLTVRADPTATSPDPVAGVVPAIQLSKDFASVSTFNATGKKTSTTPATGSVTFTSVNTVGSVTFTAGSVVSTTDGLQFALTDDLTLPRAKFGHQAPSGSVGVKAVKGGTAGNVAAGTINQVPSDKPSYLYSVTNPAATTGGTTTSTVIVQKADTDAAVASLTKAVKQQYAAWLLAPDALPPGSTAFPKTGTLSAASADTDPATLIGVAEPNFELTMTATGNVTAVDESTVTALAESRIQAEVPAQYSLVPGSEKAVIGPAQADGQVAVFPVTATASQVRHLDPDTLRQMVQGKSVDEARAILAEFGTVQIETWPGFVNSIPSLGWRLTLTIDTSSVTPSAGPSSNPTVPGSVEPTSAPSNPSSAPPSSGPVAGSPNP